MKKKDIDNLIIDIPPSPAPTGEIIDIANREIIITDETLKSEIILAFEAEYDTFVESEIIWGVWLQYFLHNNNLYCYKPKLESIMLTDSEEESYGEYIETVELLKKYNSDETLIHKLLNTSKTLDDIKVLFNSNVKGVPKLLSETPHFFHMEKPKGLMITPQNLTKEILMRIKETFNTNINPLATELSESLFVNEHEIICTDLLAYSKNDFFKYGLMLNSVVNSGSFSTQFNYFFPFEELDKEKEENIKKIVTLLNDFELKKETIIVNL